MAGDFWAYMIVSSCGPDLRGIRGGKAGFIGVEVFTEREQPTSTPNETRPAMRALCTKSQKRGF